MLQPFSDKLWLFFQCRFYFLPLQLPLNSLNLRELSCWPSAHRTNRLRSRLCYLHVNSPPASEDLDENLPLDGSMTLKKGGKDDIVASAGVFVWLCWWCVCGFALYPGRITIRLPLISKGRAESSLIYWISIGTIIKSEGKPVWNDIMSVSGLGLKPSTKVHLCIKVKLIRLTVICDAVLKYQKVPRKVSNFWSWLIYSRQVLPNWNGRYFISRLKCYLLVEWKVFLFFSQARRDALRCEN